MPNTLYALNLTGDKLAAFQQYYADIKPQVQHTPTPDNLVLTVSFYDQAGALRSLTFTMKKQNLQMGATITRAGGGPIQVRDTTYNRLSSNALQVNQQSLVSALNHFQGWEGQDDKDCQPYAVLLFYLSEALRSQTTEQTVYMALDLEAYQAAHPALTQAMIGCRLKWSSHHTILSNRQSMLTNPPPVPPYLTVARMRAFCTPPDNQTKQAILTNLNAMGF